MAFEQDPEQDPLGLLTPRRTGSNSSNGDTGFLKMEGDDFASVNNIDPLLSTPWDTAPPGALSEGNPLLSTPWDTAPPGTLSKGTLQQPGSSLNSYSPHDSAHFPLLLDNHTASPPVEDLTATSALHKPVKRPVETVFDEHDVDVEEGTSHQAKCRNSSRKSTSTASTSAWTEEDEDGGGGGGGRRRRHQLEKNRLAASKCREKKKMERASLEAREKTLADERVMLRAMTSNLQSEVLMLKNEILRHGTCDCDVIQKYISDSASRLV